MANLLPSVQDILLLTPEIIILLSGLLILLITPFVEPKYQRITPSLAIAGSLLAFIASQSLGAGHRVILNGMISVSLYSAFFQNIFLIVNFLVVLLSLTYLEEEFANMGEYYAMLMFATLGMMLMAASSDLLSIFLALELMSVSLYILAGYFRRHSESNEAAIKYYLTGVLASAFMLYGISLIYGITGTTNLRAVGDFIGVSGSLARDPALGMAMLMLVMGFGFKIAAVPFHMWLPDVYEGSPTCVTAFMSVGPKAAGFAAVLRVFYVGLGSLRLEWTVIFAILSVLTMTTGNLLALTQKSVKRMLAYSSIAHAGYAILGLTVAGTALEGAGMSSLLFYMFSYLFMNVGAFAVLILLRKKALTSESLDDFNGLAQRAPFLAFLMAILLLSLTGLPPTVGFVGKFYVFGAVIQVALTGNGFYGLLAVIAVVNAAISAFYYLRLLMNIYLKDGAETLTWRYSHSLMFVIVFSALATLYFGIFPGSILSLAQQSVKILL